MILLIDNYDSFTYNLYQFIGTFNNDIKVVRNDKITIEEIEKMKNDGVRVVVIAEKIGVHRATIYNELKRGGTPYRAEVAQKTI